MGCPEHPEYASAIIDVEQIDQGRNGEMWMPPNWDFEYVGYSADTTCDEICAMSQENVNGREISSPAPKYDGRPT